MVVMPLSDRDRAIAVAQARVRDARVGEPQFLGAEHRSDHEMTGTTERRLRSMGATQEQIQKMRDILRNHPPRPAWEVRFLLHDPRYVDGVTIATVKIDDATSVAELDVFERGGPGVG
jgi:hypothetical protein